MAVDGAQGERIASVQPAANTDTLAFTATLNIEVTRLFVVNTSSASRTFRIYHVPVAGSPGVGSALYYDKVLAANDTFELSANNSNSGVQLKEGESLYVRSNNTDVVFQIYGISANIAPGD